MMACLWLSQLDDAEAGKSHVPSVLMPAVESMLPHVLKLDLPHQVLLLDLALESVDQVGPDERTELQAALQAASTDPACRAIVIDAEGAAFCQGLDLAGNFGDGRQPDPALFQTLVDCLLLISTVRLPVIAMVAGAATGGGVGLVAACDLVLATPTAQFMLSEVVIGLLPAMITPFLLRRLPLGQVRYLTLSSRRIAANGINLPAEHGAAGDEPEQSGEHQKDKGRHRNPEDAAGQHIVENWAAHGDRRRIGNELRSPT